VDADEPSPLGRYAAGHEGGAHVTVRLVGTPLDLLVEAREHHDAVLRELRLLAVTTPVRQLPPRLLELVEVFGRTYSRPSRRPDEVVDDAIIRGRRTLDLTYEVPAGVADAACELEDRMREIDGYCAQGLLITLPRSPAIKAFAEWYLDQFTEQVAGRPARAWGAG
jgi:hypothetical protein